MNKEDVIKLYVKLRINQTIHPDVEHNHDIFEEAKIHRQAGEAYLHKWVDEKSLPTIKFLAGLPSKDFFDLEKEAKDILAKKQREKYNRDYQRRKAKDAILKQNGDETRKQLKIGDIVMVKKGSNEEYMQVMQLIDDDYFVGMYLERSKLINFRILKLKKTYNVTHKMYKFINRIVDPKVCEIID